MGAPDLLSQNGNSWPQTRSHLTGPWNLVGGDFSPTLQPPKQVCGPSDLGQTSLRPWLNSALCFPQLTKVGCGARGVTLGVLGRVGVPIPTATDAFLKMEPLLAPPSLRLQEREPGWPGLAFQTPGSGSSSLGVWFARPSFMSPLGLWPWAHWVCLSPCLPDTLGPLSLCLLSFGSLFLRVCHLPQFSLSLCSPKWGNAEVPAPSAP